MHGGRRPVLSDRLLGGGHLLCPSQPPIAPPSPTPSRYIHSDQPIPPREALFVGAPTRTRSVLRRLICLLFALGVLFALAPPSPVAALPAEEAAPGPTGAATFGGVQYLFARRGDGAVWVRQTDGLWYSGWSPLGGATDAPPAAASTDRFLVVFIRDVGGQVWARRSSDGHTYDPWQPLGTTTVSAPAAIGAGGLLYLFTLDHDGMLAVRTSTDGRNFGDPVSLGGPLAAAPVAVESEGRPVVLGTGQDGLRYHLAGARSWGAWRPLGGPGLPQLPASNAADPLTPPLTLDLGVNFISSHNWTSYQLPAYTRLRPGLAKFSMFYDAFPTTPVFGTTEIDDAIALGASTVIFRTAETRIAPDEVERQLRAPLPGDGRSLLDYIGDHQARGTGVEFWIEVGNEPDLAGLSPLVARYALLATIRDVAPHYRATHPNLRWIASLPTREGLPRSALPDLSRPRLSRSAPLRPGGWPRRGRCTLRRARRPHLRCRHAPAVLPDAPRAARHLRLRERNGDAFCPARRPRPGAGAHRSPGLRHRSRDQFKPVMGREGANSSSRRCADSLPACAAFALFTLSLDPEWYAGTGERCTKLELIPCSRYALDVDEFGVLDPSFAGATGIGQCYRLTPEQAATLPTCGPPCLITGTSPPPPRPRSANQRAPCQVGADGPPTDSAPISGIPSLPLAIAGPSPQRRTTPEGAPAA